MKSINLAMLFFAVSFTSFSHAALTCDEKRGALESELETARLTGDTAKIAGLHTALADVNVNCTSGSIAANLRRHIDKIDAKITDKQADLRGLESDLIDAKASLDATKIRKYERKIRNKQEDIAELQLEMETARANLAQISS